MQILNGYIKLSKTRKNLVLKSLLITILIRISLHIISFSRINNYITSISKSGKNNGEKLEDILWAVEVASDLIPRSTCLTTAIVGYFMLSKYDYSSNLKVGVIREDKFEAHAWLEMDNNIVLGKLDTEYVPLIELDNLNQ
ncbi:MAG: lasso peptide biosynthesis B2 protein [Methanobacterium sp.]|nr:lasso peptide biosynthesis B2 protein [Methanobacterium sp.]